MKRKKKSQYAKLGRRVDVSLRYRMEVNTEIMAQRKHDTAPGPEYLVFAVPLLIPPQRVTALSPAEQLFALLHMTHLHASF
jgi:hypothetical protein